MKTFLTAIALITATATGGFASVSFDDRIADAEQAAREAQQLAACVNVATTFLMSDGAITDPSTLSSSSMEMVSEQTGLVMEATGLADAGIVIDELSIMLIAGGKSADLVKQYRLIMRECYGL